ncbi:MAG: plasmid recombination protein [Clostridia bacterium]|nr:plasmid recombination protein [Clostridia bacterium]
MAKEFSVTITAGIGSERHNHSFSYRQTLPHVNGSSEDIIELVPYCSYEEQINEIMKPYIDEYNERQKEKYKKAWERYNSGVIKSKPKKKDYKEVTYEYYNEHKNDAKKNPKTGKVERIPIFRSLILGIGDCEDRQSGRITKEEAERILRRTIKQFQKDFPCFKILGATCHCDEKGFFHCHLDYFILYEKENPKGLKVGTGLEAALERMNYAPEQSIVNGRDKVPLLFNAMRNQIYREMEAAMVAEGIRMQYGVSKQKEPDKNSGKNQRLKDWQKTQDAVRELQHNKNAALDILERDKVSPDDLKTALTTAIEITDKIDEIENSPRKRVDKNKVIVEFRLLDQLRSFVDRLISLIAVFLQDRDEYKNKYEALRKEKNDREAETKSKKRSPQKQEAR